ncbi:MAG: hypothetical protein IJ138_01615 [Clostridia bacterium]|nr:hypothetical protein [Clostridia bacterium]
MDTKKKKKKRRRKVQPRFYLIISLFILVIVLLIGVLIWMILELIKGFRENAEQEASYQQYIVEYNAGNFGAPSASPMSLSEFKSAGPPTPTPTPTPSSNRKWLPAVTGYNKNDSNNGYAGIFGRSVTGLRVSGGKAYRVHIKGGKWLPAVTGNNQNDLNNGFAGNAKGSPIDAVAISGGIYYEVHIKGGKLYRCERMPISRSSCMM